MNCYVPDTHRISLKPLAIALLLGLATPTLAEPVTSIADFFQPDGMTATAEITRPSRRRASSSLRRAGPQ